ncbi:hypothetical protein EVAR_31909_1 [Eumeta japonica]|uniref:Uncharacterized protein n=1 Tax=Eumeta variegata TaxID=151549 RepID=A0A4C1XRF2_EUMVA|nr:hypothetical protein EVAR_31909_1 [Eumeta japonica]
MLRAIDPLLRNGAMCGLCKYITSCQPAASPHEDTILSSSIDIAVNSNLGPAFNSDYGTDPDYDSRRAIDPSLGFIHQFDPS